MGLRNRTTSRFVVSRRLGEGTYWAPGINDHTVINQALTDAAATTQKAAVTLLDGIFACAGQVVLPDAPNVSLIGAGRDNTVLRFANLTTACITKQTPATARFKYRFQGYTIDNQGKTNVGSVGINYENLSNCTTEDVVFTNVETAIGLLGSSYFNRFLNCDVEECKYGEFLTNSAGGTVYPNENAFTGIKHAKSTGGTGCEYPVVIMGGNDNHWVQCSFEDFLTGIDISDIGNTFTNCRIECNDRTGTIIYIRFNTGGNNNGFLNCYFSGNKWIDRYTSIVDNGAGNAIMALSTFKDQFFKAERNALTADDMVYMKRSGSGDGKAVYVADDTYAASGSPLGFVAKQVRSTGKFFQGLLAGVEKFYVDATGQGFLANGLIVGGPVDNQWSPNLYGYLSMTYDPAVAVNTTQPTSGLLQLVRLPIAKASTITHAYLNVSVAAAGATAAYCALYTPAGALLAQSDNQSANLGTTGVKTFTFTPTDVAAGYVYVAFWVVATTTPALSRAGSSGFVNNKLGTNYRYATADAGLTAAAPANLGAKTTGPISYWLAVD